MVQVLQVPGGGVGMVQADAVMLGENHQDGRHAQRVELGKELIGVEVHQRQGFFQQGLYFFFHTNVIF